MHPDDFFQLYYNERLRELSNRVDELLNELSSIAAEEAEMASNILMIPKDEFASAITASMFDGLFSRLMRDLGDKPVIDGLVLFLKAWFTDEGAREFEKVVEYVKRRLMCDEV